MNVSDDLPQRYFIYGLFNDQIKELVYVGATAFPEQRFYNHKLVLARSFAESCRMEIFEEAGRYDWHLVESAWICEMAGLGCRLLNKHIPTNDYEKYLGYDANKLSLLRGRAKRIAATKKEVTA